jgi:hypothetical protein
MNPTMIRLLVEQGILLTGPYRPRTAADAPSIRAAFSARR